jgi:hypothetical protein
MRASDVFSIVTSALFGAVAGVLMFDLIGAVVVAAVGVLVAYLAARANVRPMVATTTFVGAAAGALIGASVVETICLPDTCTGFEVGGAIVFGLASLVGVGLVAALVTRSFDEYNESVDDGRPPPEVGCEMPDEG